jgi:ubiquinone/menaquinone biosynthesis C-methylase UbiE
MINYKYKYQKYKKKYIEYKNNKVGGGSKKKTKKKINIDDLITKEKQLEYFKQIEPHFKNTYLKQLKLILNLEKTYKNVKSNEQIRNVVKYSKIYDTNIYNRLITLLTKNINSWQLHKLYRVNIYKQNDDVIYELINKLKKNYPKKKPQYKKNSFERKNERHAQQMIRVLTNWTFEPLIQNYDSRIFKKIINNDNKKELYKQISDKLWLDFGCGDGNKTKGIQKYAKFNEKNIYTADIYEWFKYNKNRTLPYNFIPIKKNKPLPIKNNKFDIVSLIMVLHHVENIDNLLREMNRIVKKGGFIYLVEHDVFTDIDKMLVDIEHSLYETDQEQFKKNYYCKCFNYLERRLLFKNYGFEFVWGDFISDDIYKEIGSTRAVHDFYVKVKDI